MDLMICPFCGATPEVVPWHGGGPRKRFVGCSGDDCEVRPMVTGSTRARAIAKWNRRAYQSESGETSHNSASAEICEMLVIEIMAWLNIDMGVLTNCNFERRKEIREGILRVITRKLRT